MMRTFLTTVVLFAGSVSILSAAEITSSTEQKALVEALSGAAHLGVGGLPDVISQRFSDSPEIFTTARYLKAKYEAAGLEAEIAEYNPLDAFPYYAQSTERTYRQYFQRMIPTLQLEFDAFCAGTLPKEKDEAVTKRLERVGHNRNSICAEPTDKRVEFYIRATVAHTTRVTQNMLKNRTQATWPNVLAFIKTGEHDGGPVARPLCVIGAHMDSVARDGGGRGPIVSPGTLAPGADDNATGTAAVFTLAKALRDWVAAAKPQLKCDLLFAHFSGEEEGLLGSIAFTKLQLQRPVLWMVNFDMIGYQGGETRVMNVGYHKAHGRELAEYFEPSTDTLKCVVVESETFTYSSDQIAFWESGIPAISISEQACGDSACSNPFKTFNPYLHTPDDVASHLDFGYAADIINNSYVGLTRALIGKSN